MLADDCGTLPLPEVGSLNDGRVKIRMTNPSIIFGNIEGLYPSKMKHKMAMLREKAVLEGAVVLAMTESHLRSDIKDAEVQIGGFQVYRADRAENRRKGGVVAYVRDDYASEIKILSSGSNSVVEWLLIFFQRCNLALALLYRPPACLPGQFSEVLQLLGTEVETLGSPSPTVVLCGDMNLPLVKWPSREIYGGSAADRLQAGYLLGFADDYLMEQYVNEPTRLDNVLDLFFTNNEELPTDVRVVDTLLSDHRLITVGVNILNSRKARDRELPDGLSSLNFFHSSVDWDKVGNELAMTDWNSLFMSAVPQTMYVRFCEVIGRVCRKFMPRRTLPTCRSIPRDRRALMRKRTRLNKRMINGSTAELRDRVVAIERLLVASHERERATVEGEVVSKIKSNPKYFYKYVHSKSSVRAPIGPFERGGALIGDPGEKGNMLKAQYESVFSNPKYSVEENTVQCLQEAPGPVALTEVDFTPDDIENSIGKLSASSASGPDGIPAILLKRCVAALKLPIYMLWRSSLDAGEIPEHLKLGIITPIYKGGPRTLPKNYRPVTLTSHIVKIFERVVVNKLVGYMDEARLFNDGQHGFRRCRSCLSQLLQHHHRLLGVLEGSSVADVVYLDFAKAFDKVDHGILMRKLRLMGVGGPLLAWIRCFLLGREQAVAVEGVVSARSPVGSGVPQGSVLGPVLFLVHIADIDEHLSHTAVSSFADDTRLTMLVKCREDVGKMQGDLDEVYGWAEANNMMFNGTKFEHLRYGRAVEDAPLEYVAPDGSRIVRQTKVTDLGVILSDSGRFDEQINAVVLRGRRLLGWILRSFATREPSLLLPLFKTMVLPVLEYCSQLWCPRTVGAIRRVEAVQRHVTAKMRGLQNLNYWERLARLKLYSLERRRERYMLIYVWKVLRNLVPNIGDPDMEIRLVTGTSRRGEMCRIPPLNNRAPVYVQTLKESSFCVHGPRLFNELPRELREFRGAQNVFKRELDKFLQSVPDLPSLPHYHQRAGGNSLLDQVVLLRRDGV